MTDIPAVTVRYRDDGTVVMYPHGTVDADVAVQVQQTLIHMVRRVRPLRLVVDLGDVVALDPLHRGAIAATMDLANDYHVAAFIENPTAVVEATLVTAGVPRHRIRHTAI